MKNMAKVVEGTTAGIVGFKKTILLDRKRLVELPGICIRMRTLSWNEFAVAVGSSHEKRNGTANSNVRLSQINQKRKIIFYANPQEWPLVREQIVIIY
ncbi:hypothetical protein NC652_026092 [Populus alba x Populus x berolinensis]|nr:hypothetical protein NC652_026092 [Populus alba x Populus x berolinensis]